MPDPTMAIRVPCAPDCGNTMLPSSMAGSTEPTSNDWICVGVRPVAIWNDTGNAHDCAAAHTGSHTSRKYGRSAGGCIGSMIERRPSDAARSISATAASVSGTGIIADGAKRLAYGPNVSANQSLYTRAHATCSSGSSTLHTNKPL